MAPGSNPSDLTVYEPQSFAPPSRAELRLQARDAVHRFLGNTTGDAADMVARLTDDEIDALVAAASDRLTAVQGIKAVFTAVQNRQQREHEDEVRATLAKAQQARADREAAEHEPAEVIEIPVDTSEATADDDSSPE